MMEQSLLTLLQDIGPFSPNDITTPRFSASHVYLDDDIDGTESNLTGTVYRTPLGQGRRVLC